MSRGSCAYFGGARSWSATALPAGQYTGFVLCSFCKSALKHNRTTSGTTHLRDHVTHCLKNPSRPNKLNHPSTSKPITAFFEAPVTQLSQSDKKKLLNASVNILPKISDHLQLLKTLDS